MKTSLLTFGVSIAVAGAIAGAIACAADFSFAGCFAVVIAAILVNGFVVTLEDDLPGGFNNPNGTHTPAYAGIAIRGSKVLFAGASFAGATLFVGIAHSQAQLACASGCLLLGLACLLSPLALLSHARWALWGAAVCVVSAFAVGYVLAV